MTDSRPEQPQQNPLIEAIRKAEEGILAVGENISPEEALSLGRGLIRARLNFDIAERAKGPNMVLIDQRIAHFESLLEENNKSGLRGYLLTNAESLSSDPTWMNSVGPAMEEFPGKLRTIAKVIPHD